MKPGETRRHPLPHGKAGAWLGLFSATGEALWHLINSTPYVNTCKHRVLEADACSAWSTLWLPPCHCHDCPCVPACPPRRSRPFCHFISQDLLLSQSPHPLLHPTTHLLAQASPALPCRLAQSQGAREASVLGSLQWYAFLTRAKEKGPSFQTAGPSNVCIRQNSLLTLLCTAVSACVGNTERLHEEKQTEPLGPSAGFTRDKLCEC